MLLINPVKREFDWAIYRYISISIPVSLGVLAGYMKRWGVKNIRVVDESITPITEKNLRDLVQGLDQPLVIGITVLTAHAGRAYEVAEMYKKAYPDCTVVLGGIHATALPHEALATGFVDFVVRGEGEEPFRQLYFALREGKEWKNIRGLSYLENGEIVHTPDGDLIDNLDDVPQFPYELFGDPSYDRGFITGARGCPFKCSYCSQRLLTGLTYRWNSVERVIENLKILVDVYKQDYIFFYDDNFSVNKKRVFDICDKIIEAGLHKKAAFSIQTRADCLYEEILPAMRKANFQTVGLGMETGVERIAREIEKDETVALHLEKIKLLKKHGFKVSLFMIYGFPGETAADREESFQVALKADVGYVKFNNLIPYPGTAIYEKAKNSGTLNVLPGWFNFNTALRVSQSFFSSVPLPYVPEGTTEFELKRDIIKNNLKYQFQWKIIKKLMVRDKGTGWLSLPPYWFLKPVEILALIKVTLLLANNFLLAFLPLKLTQPLFSFIKKMKSISDLPEDLKAESRSFKRAQVPLLREKEPDYATSNSPHN